NLKPHKSPGPSGISVRFLQTFVDDIANILCQDFKKFNMPGSNLSWWKRGYVVLIPKSGDLSSIDNWRPISLLNIEWKIFTKIVDKTMRDKWESTIHNSQIG